MDFGQFSLLHIPTDMNEYSEDECDNSGHTNMDEYISLEILSGAKN